MKLKHWVKEYRFKKANQRAMTKYWQRAVAERIAIFEPWGLPEYRIDS